jgi:hypothetical protein
LSELDEAWIAALAEAEQKARLAGRRDIAEYLSLKNSNDLLRKAGVDWLLNSFTAQAGEANRHGSSIQISKVTAHRFKVGNSTMVGTLLTLTSGVRTLFVEAGWPRTPRDGIVRGGGLACAHIRHLGIKNAGDELRLVKSNSGAPVWNVTSRGTKHTTVLEADIRRHLALLVDKR